MEILNEIRNNFIHFIPCNWSIELAMLPGRFEEVLLVIEFLIMESGNIRFYDNDEDEKKCLSELIEKIRAELNRARERICDALRLDSRFHGRRRKRYLLEKLLLTR